MIADFRPTFQLTNSENMLRNVGLHFGYTTDIIKVYFSFNCKLSGTFLLPTYFKLDLFESYFS